MFELISRGAELIEKAKKVLVFTGAGLSTESGIPDFRSPGGIWEKYDPSEFYFDRFLASESAREKYWKMSYEYYEVMKAARPNSAHLAIKEIEDRGKLLALVTQNIDSLHHRAGNSPEKIIEIHGTAFSVTCLSCGRVYDRDEIQKRLSEGLRVPYCDACRGPLKPATISFGQAMPQEKLDLAFKCASACDLCMVLGSSLAVYPAASIPAYAAEAGAPLMIVNRDPTPLDSKAALVIRGSVTKVMEMLLGM